MEIHGVSDEHRNRDGLHMCHKCGKSGRLSDIKQHLGIDVQNTDSRKDWGAAERKVELLPDVAACHQMLLEDEAAMDYLVNGRGFSRDIIVRQQIGLVPRRYFRECGEVRAILYPYLVNGNCVFGHFRTLPTMPLSENRVPKAFSSPLGWDAPLYNGEILRDGLREVLLVEGEANTIAALDHGVEDVCGVPGANFKKAEWITTLDALGLEKIYICYDKDSAGQKAAQTVAARIGIERCWKIVLPDFTVTTDEGEVRKGKDLNEWFVSGGGTAERLQKLKEEAQLFDVDGVSSSRDATQEFLDELLGKDTLEPKYKTGWPSLNKLVGFEDGDVIDILAEEKIGKLQPLSALVLRTDGWVRMGDLKIGDPLASEDGAPSVVTRIFKHGLKAVYRVTFSDGRSTLVGKEHLWKVASRRNHHRDGYRVVDTEELSRLIATTDTFFIPLFNGEYGVDSSPNKHKKKYPIDPWFMGALLGDGGFTNPSPTFTKKDTLVIDAVHGYAKDMGCILHQIDELSWRIVSRTVEENYLSTHLRRLGLKGKSSLEKFIPQRYLNGTRQARLSLLAGLMDTDGSLEGECNVPCFNTSSPQLAKDVQYLVRSLGGVATVTSRMPHYTYNDEMLTGKKAYRVYIKLHEKVCRYSHKAAKELPRTRDFLLSVVSVVEEGEEETQCIAVSHPSHLYVTDDFILTHNTTLGMNLIEHMVNEYGEDGIIICLEMTRARLARKWVCHLAQIADNIPKTIDEAKALADAFKDAIPRVQNATANRPGNLYFCYPKYKTEEDIYTLIRDCIRRYGVKWIMLDNLQLLCDTTLGSKNRTQHLSAISKVTAKIGKDYGVQMIRILQPHRIAQGKMVSTSNVDGASQVAKDCDCMMTAHRNKIGELTADQFESCQYVEQEQAFDSKMLLGVGLSRYSSGGYVTLHYEGATSTVSEMNAAQMAKIQAATTQTVGYAKQLENLNLPTGAVIGATVYETHSTTGDITI